jgi:hemolysin III
MKQQKEATLGEEIFNAVTHGVGALLSIAALVLLVIKADTGLELFSVLIFSMSSLMLYTMSTLYHAFPRGKTKNVFRRFDHLSIYLLIAGTYTPFSLLLLETKQALIMVIFEWTLAIIGIVFKSIWIRKFVIIHVLIFLLMGWACIIYREQIIQAMDIRGFTLLLLGGVSYSIGVIFFAFELFKFHHAIWHFFVLFGTIFHFFSILFFVL